MYIYIYIYKHLGNNVKVLTLSGIYIFKCLFPM